jgi:hypothetical protein
VFSFEHWLWALDFCNGSVGHDLNRRLQPKRRPNHR